MSTVRPNQIVTLRFAVAAATLGISMLLIGCSRHTAAAASTAAAPASTASTTGPAAASQTGSSGNTAVPTAPATDSAGAAAAAPGSAPTTTHPDLVFLASAAFDACDQPAQPATPPSGATATRAQMAASQSAAKTFDTATNVYLACVDAADRGFTQRYARLMSVQNLRDIRQMQIRMHNSAVDVDQGVADRFNRQLRIFKARGPS